MLIGTGYRAVGNKDMSKSSVCVCALYVCCGCVRVCVWSTMKMWKVTSATYSGSLFSFSLSLCFLVLKIIPKTQFPGGCVCSGTHEIWEARTKSQLYTYKERVGREGKTA